MARTVMVMVRFTPREAKHIRAIVKANSGTVSEFIRTCVSTTLAQQGDPEAYEMLTEMITQGMNRVLELKVKKAVADAKRK